MRRRVIGWLTAAAMVCAMVPLLPGVAAAGGGVTESPNIAAVPTGKVIWTSNFSLFFQVTVPNGVAPPAVTYADCPGACSLGQLSTQGIQNLGGSTTYQYMAQPLPNVAPQPLTVSYSVYSTPYQDQALVGVDNSLLEFGPPSATAVSFTVFAHAGGTVSTSSVQVNYNGSPVSVSPTANGNGSASVTFSHAVQASDQMQVSYSDTVGNLYETGGQPSSAAQWLTGAVTDGSGNPVPGVQVMAFNPSAPPSPAPPSYTGGDGHFMLPISAPGSYQVQIQPHGTSYVQQQTSVTIAAGANTLPTVQLSTPVATVSGVVYDGSTTPPTPLANAFVNFFEMTQNPNPNGPPAGGQGQTDAAGHFTVALPVAGRYGMNVQPPFNSNPHNLVAYTATEDVTGGALSLNVTLQAASAVLTGTVTGPGGPVANTPVSFINVAGQGFAFAQTNGSGVYSLPVGPGSWQVQLMGQSGSTPLQDLNVQQSVTPAGDLSDGQVVVPAGSGQTITDNINLTAYDVPLDVAVTIGGTVPPAAFAFATQGGVGPNGPHAGPGVFASPQMNSDGTTGDYASTGKLHLHLTAGTWQVGAAIGNPQTGIPTFRQFTVTITGSGSSANVAVTGRGVSLTAGSPPLATVALQGHNQVITVTVLGGANAQPVQGAMVGAFNSDGDFIPGDGAPPQTDSSGQNTIHVSRGLWNAVVMAPGYGISAPEAVDTTGGAGSYSVTINLGAQLPYTISGSVMAGGNPVMGAQV
ncbi:MAG TPA: carboxypeptidase-like regulatory domain-containing protein, partial [Bacillota bacterium]|nr:carboxypeptidase-like regulatory domain-containing protein [Bacillota bacterium]